MAMVSPLEDIDTDAPMRSPGDMPVMFPPIWDPESGKKTLTTPGSASSMLMQDPMAAVAPSLDMATA